MVSFFSRVPFFIRILIVVIILLIGFLLIQFGKFFLENQTFYRLKKVKVYGVRYSNVNNLVKEIGLDKDTNLVLLNKRKIEEKILKINRIEEAQVSIKFPDMVFLRIKEKLPSFLLKTKDELATITAQGELVALNHNVNHFDNLIIILNEAPNIDYAVKTKKFQNFISFYNQLSEKEKSIKNIFSDISLESEVIFHSKNDQLTINLGSSLTFEKLRKVYYTYLYFQEKKLNTKYIDLQGKLVKYKKI